jgi:hypothetical protein
VIAPPNRLDIDTNNDYATDVDTVGIFADTFD